MPDLTSILALVAATTFLVTIPGPNVALIVANSLSRGFKFGAATVFGTTIGVGCQLLLVAFGLATLIAVAADVFVWLKWIGVAYLIFLGIQAFRGGAFDPAPEADNQMAAEAIRQGAILAVLNPKTLLFNAAFLPQFVSVNAASSELFVLGAIYLFVLGLGDLVWAGGADRARPFLQQASRWPNRISGACFVSAGIGLALARTER